MFETHHAENIVWVLGWRSKDAYLCTPWARKGVFGYLGWVCLKRTMPKKYGVGSGVTLQTRIPVLTTGQKRCFWIPGMGVFETHHAKNIVWVLGWRSKHAYLCTPWATKGMFRYLGWVCLKRTMPKNMVRVLGWRPKHEYHCTPWARKGVFGCLERVCLKCTRPKNMVWVLGWRPKHEYLCTSRARNGVFGYLGWVCLKRTMPKILCGIWGGAPNRHTTAHRGPQKAFLDTWDGCI